MTNKSKSSYRTIGAISGHFPPREKTPRGGSCLSAADKACIALNHADAVKDGLDAAAMQRYVLDRVKFDRPTIPAFMVIEGLALLLSAGE